MAFYGYARASTLDQDVAIQEEALRRAGCAIWKRGRHRMRGFDVRDEDMARLSPLAHEHINMLGRYAFTLPELVARGELRPLRSPTALVEYA